LRRCHGDSATGSGVLPDLRYSGLIKSPEAFDTTVRQGTRVDQGMVAFKDEVSPQDLEQIRAYVIHRANEDKLALPGARKCCPCRADIRAA
jgi:quinohemoprotein ethanol dehydrogenase